MISAIYFYSGLTNKRIRTHFIVDDDAVFEIFAVFFVSLVANIVVDESIDAKPITNK